MTKARDLANASTALSAVSATELAFVDGVTSAIQTQMDAKAPSSTAVTLTGTQTLTNKTLTNPVIASVINNTLTSTTGDIIYASAANTPARLGIGSSAQVLTVAAGIPSWATPASSAFVGVRAGRSTNQSLANATVTVITWEYETYDTDSLWTSSPNPTRITVPSGKGGYYLCIAQIHFGTNVNGFRTCTLRINGSDTRTQTEIGTSSRGSSVYAIDILNLSAGDYIEVQGYQDSGGSLNAIGDASNDYTYITVQKVG